MPYILDQMTQIANLEAQTHNIYTAVASKKIKTKQIDQIINNNTILYIKPCALRLAALLYNC
jgi:hypothetical protein